MIIYLFLLFKYLFNSFAYLYLDLIILHQSIEFLIYFTFLFY